MENAGYFFAAFAVIWAVVFGYVLYLVNKSAKISRQGPPGRAVAQARFPPFTLPPFLGPDTSCRSVRGRPGRYHR